MLLQKGVNVSVALVPDFGEASFINSGSVYLECCSRKVVVVRYESGEFQKICSCVFRLSLKMTVIVSLDHFLQCF